MGGTIRPKPPATAREIMKCFIENKKTKKAYIMTFEEKEFDTIERVIFTLIDLGYNLDYLEITPMETKKIKIFSKNT